VERLRDTTGWSVRSIYRALKVLGDYHQWAGEKDTDFDAGYPMPRPIEVGAEIQFERKKTGRRKRCLCWAQDSPCGRPGFAKKFRAQTPDSRAASS
jgi:hypothetical protein